MRDKRVLVLGDVMLDEFVWGRVSRISPEAPVPVVRGHEPELPPRRRRQRGRQRALARRRGRARRRWWAATRRATRVREALARGGRRGAAGRRGRRAAAPRSRRAIVAHGQQVVRADREDTGDVPAGARERRSSTSVRRELAHAAAPRRLRLPEGRRHGRGCCGACCRSRGAAACRCWWTRSCATSASTAGATS